jgi:uncharacterized protein YkwD
MYRYFLFLISFMGILGLAACQPSAPDVLPVATTAVKPAAPAEPTSVATPTLPPLETISQEADQASEPTPTLTEETPADEAATQEQSNTEVPLVSETTATVTPVATQDPDCEDQAVFIKDVTVPDGTFFDPGIKFTKTWQVKNSGTCTWNGYSLVFAQGDMMNGPLTSPLPPAAPGDTIDISLELTAPQRTGLQTGNWIFQNAAGERFGIGVPATGMVWAQIQVDSFPAATDASQSSENPSGKGATVVFANPGAGGTGGNVGHSSCPAEDKPAAASEILGYVNAARVENGLASLELQSQLSTAALGHSRDMACEGFVDHDGSDGSTWYDRVTAQGYTNSASARENIYVGDPAYGGTPKGAFNWWMNSQVHRDNILNANVSQVGIAYVYLKGSPYGGYYTLLVARP